MAGIILTTLNARYSHTAFGLRYLLANMGDLQADTCLLEFTIHQKPVEIVEQLLQQQPAIIGLGVYIWNVTELAAVVAILKQVAPQIVLVLGGPEVSHPPDLPAVTALADYIITGPGDVSFAALCQQLLNGERPDAAVISGQSVALERLASPYPYYSDSDVRQRIVYVEASRGCPFRCEFCLSALDTTAKPFELTAFLAAMDTLYQRGARQFKFIDRTFNLKVDTSIAILEFFLARMAEPLFLHFELIPDNLPERLKAVIQRFPPGSLQFEVGVQSFDPLVQQRISRKQDNAQTQANLRWLRQHSAVHIHADLIVGLPGDDLAGFGRSFDQLYALQPHEIQVGILKRLRGAPINRHSLAFDMRYDPQPPYAILSSRDLDFATVQRLSRFARFWDLIGNSGRFSASLPLITAQQPFERFLRLSDGLYEQIGSTGNIALKRLFEMTYQQMTDTLAIDAALAAAALHIDYQRAGEKAVLRLQGQPALAQPKASSTNKRQRQVVLNSEGQ
jgi:hypothetical protein